MPSTYTGQRDDLPDAVLFDMDGLLVDTEPQWYAAETATVHQLGGVWGKQQQVDLLGSNLEYAAEYMREHTSTAVDADSVQLMLLDNMTAELAKGVTFRPGVGSLLSSLIDASVPLSLVTSSVKVHAEMVLARLPMTTRGASQPFEHVVTADDVTNLKPHPEPYLTALDLMGVRPERTVALEDSPNGMMSATAAGCLVVGVPSVVPLEAGPGQMIVNSLDDVTIPMLLELLTRW